jgi:type I restriction enzyme R subunit
MRETGRAGDRLPQTGGIRRQARRRSVRPALHLAYNAPLRTRKERAEWLRKDRKDFFDQYGSEAKAILHQMLDKYAEHGTSQFVLPDVLEVPPISEHGNVVEITDKFGGSEKLIEALNRLQTLLYVA